VGKNQRHGRHVVTALAVAGAAWSLLPGSALAEDNWTAARLLDPQQSILAPARVAPFPLTSLTSHGGLSFDLGGSEEQKLQLQLAEPLAIGTALTRRQNAFGVSETTVGGALGWMANDDLGLSVSSSQSTMKNTFQALGSIHCEDGVLAKDSFTASNCYFIDPPATARMDTLSLGLNYAPTQYARTGVSLFRQNFSAGSTVSDPQVNGLRSVPFPSALQGSLLPQLPGQTLDFMDSEITGIDLEFQLGFSTNRAGDISLGLQLTRILDADLGGQFIAGPSLQDWSLSGPADSARVSLDWRKGAFSGGVESYYRAPIDFMNRSSLESAATFDVHFTWRMPWNANLSVGASNLLNSGSDDNASNDSNRVDPFESVYGRIPYVRYEQDL
jgi:hypothetical protein